MLAFTGARGRGDEGEQDEEEKEEKEGERGDEGGNIDLISCIRKALGNVDIKCSVLCITACFHQLTTDFKLCSFNL